MRTLFAVISFCVSTDAAIAQSFERVDLENLYISPPSKTEKGVALLTAVSWDDFLVMAHLGGVSTSRLEENLKLANDAGFTERKNRTALIEFIASESERYRSVRQEILSSDYYVYSNIPVPDYDFARQGFSLCIPSAISPQKENSRSLTAAGLSFSGQFQINYSDLQGLGGVYSINRCQDPNQRFTDYRPDPMTVSGVVPVSTNLSLNTMFFRVSELDIAERIQAKIQALPDRTMQAEVICSNLSFSSNSVGSCKPWRISFGLFSDRHEIWMQYVRQPDGRWGAAIGDLLKTKLPEADSVGEAVADAAPAKDEPRPVLDGHQAPDLADLLASAEALYAAALSAPVNRRAAGMAAVQEILDRIVNEHPVSDEAIAILLGLSVGSISTADVAAFTSADSAHTPTAPTDNKSTTLPIEASSTTFDEVLSACYRDVLEREPGALTPIAVTVRVKVSSEGEIVGVPSLESPQTTDALSLKSFQNALAALELCNPRRADFLPPELQDDSPPQLLPYAGRQVDFKFGSDLIVTFLVDGTYVDRTTAAPVVHEPPNDLKPERGSSEQVQELPWTATTLQDEAKLNLSRDAIRRIQTRLAELSFDPRGADGVLGSGTRRAISAWQTVNGIPATGFLDERQLWVLRRQGQTTVAKSATNMPVVAPSTPTGRWRTASEADQSRLKLSRQDNRDIQARLTVLSYDAGGVDGALGRKTREAVASWQLSAGIPPTGFLDGPQLAELRRHSETALASWLRSPENRKAYEPPAPVPLTPKAISGSWRYTSTCGRNSRLPEQRIAGVIQLDYRGGPNFSGSVSNTQGFRGSLNGRVSGRQLNATIRWGFLIGSTTLTGRVSDDARSVSGRDSLGCSFRATKN